MGTRKRAPSSLGDHGVVCRLVLLFANGTPQCREHVLRPGPNVIGRHLFGDLDLGEYVSAKHVTVHYTPPDVLLIEDGSTNGSFVDGARVDRGARADHQSLITCDETAWTLSIEPNALGSMTIPDDSVACAWEMRRAYQLCRQAAATSMTVLILGESGCGKERIARAVHTLSKRRGKFVALNCASETETLLESKLFGHVKGTFTGADRDQPGIFEAGRGGTVFLDEIGDASPKVQKALLRALQERKILRVGTSEEIPIDVRIVAATNRDVRGVDGEAPLRFDVLQRLSGFIIEVPPLRRRREEILPLCAYRLATEWNEKAPVFQFDAAKLILSDPWPGNVRELFNVVDQLRARSGPGVAYSAPLVREVLRTVRGRAPDVIAEPRSRQHYERLLREHDSIAGIAEELKISERTVGRDLEGHGLLPPPPKGGDLKKAFSASQPR